MHAERDRVFNILKYQWQFNRSNRGCLFDRGSADSYYGRGRTPHYGGVGGDSGPRIAVSDLASVTEYMLGYDENEKFGDKKDWS